MHLKDDLDCDLESPGCDSDCFIGFCGDDEEDFICCDEDCEICNDDE